MARITPLSGFPEWLPQGRIVEQSVIDTLRSTFELHGFAGIHTRAVEPMSQLLRKGEIDKEVYVLRRLADSDDDGAAGSTAEDDALGLHFDLTVPFARYVLENAGKLSFPFRRYQIQPVWRGERPQDGRFREFIQADIDIVGNGELAFHHEVEIPLVVADALSRLPIPPVRIQVNNRRLVEGFYTGLGLSDVAAVLRCIDKLDKIGPDAVAEQLRSVAGASHTQAQLCLQLAAISTEDESFVDQVRALGVTSPLLEQGLAELAQVMAAGASDAPGLLVAELKIARGLDYYTGTVYETQLLGHSSLGSICSGGRYDNLASAGNQSHPGVGISVGVSRLVSRMLGGAKGTKPMVQASREVPSVVLVAVVEEDQRAGSNAIAAVLRSRGIACEVAPSAAKFGKQIRYADRRGIPYVWFPGEASVVAGASTPGTGAASTPGAGVGVTPGEVKDIRSGEQVPADAGTWAPPLQDLRPALLPVE